jgi:hypothetical protein
MPQQVQSNVWIGVDGVPWPNNNGVRPLRKRSQPAFGFMVPDHRDERCGTRSDPPQSLRRIEYNRQIAGSVALVILRG